MIFIDSSTHQLTLLSFRYSCPPTYSLSLSFFSPPLSSPPPPFVLHRSFICPWRVVDKSRSSRFNRRNELLVSSLFLSQFFRCFLYPLSPNPSNPSVSFAPFRVPSARAREFEGLFCRFERCSIILLARRTLFN